ncbi:hypothetical protein [Microbacterium lacusdiani]
MRLISLAWASRDDRGSALAAVVGIVLLTVVVALTVATTTVQSLERTDDTRDTVSAEFAAEAGVAVAQAAIEGAACGGGTFASSSAAPFHRTIVQHVVGGVMTNGCPTADEEYRIVATGYDSAASYAADDGRSVEARYEAVPQPFAPTGPAMYSHGGMSFGNNGDIQPLTGDDMSIMMHDGDLVCANSISGNTDVIVKSGNLTAGNRCEIGGDTWVLSGSATLANGASIAGKLVASHLVIENNHSGTLGPLYADDTTGSAPGQLADHGPVQSKSAAGAMPTVPGWVDFEFEAADWPGYTVVTLSGCNRTAAKSALDSLAGAPGVLNALHCIELDLTGLGQTTVQTLTANVAIFAPSFKLSQTKFAGQTGNERLWLVTPDYIDNGVPSCGEADGTGIIVPDDTSLANSSEFTNLAVMLYTPCSISFGNSLVIHGQVYANSIHVEQHLTYRYAPTGLPGTNLTDGTDTPPTELTLSSYRNTSTTAKSLGAP